MDTPYPVPTTSLPDEASVEEVNERRGCFRHTIALKGQCHPVTAMGANHRWPVNTWDLSASGVGVVVCRRFEPGTLLAVSLTGASQETVRMPLARVRRVRERGEHWLLGCTWVDELENADLGLLINQ